MNKQKRILLVIPTLELGGAERQAIRLARFLKDHDHHVEVWGFNSPDGLGAEFCDSLGVTHKCIHFYGGLGRFRFPFRVIKYIRLFRKFKPDVIYSYCDGPNVLCGLIWKYSGAKLHIWGQRSQKIFHENKRHLNWALNNSSHFISNSQPGKLMLQKLLKGRKNICIELINNGVDIENAKETSSTWKKRLGINNETKTALMISNLMHLQGKDHITLIKAWRKVVNYNNAILILAGRLEESTQSIISKALKLDVLPNIIILGKVNDISGLLQSIDLVVHSSKNEGSPNAVLEGMASKKPIVATNIEGINEILPMKQKSFLSEIDDEVVMGDNIIEIFKNDELSENLGNMNYKHVKKNYSVNEMGRKTMLFIEKNI